jgi:Flp pilus assembly protein TadG
MIKNRQSRTRPRRGIESIELLLGLPVLLLVLAAGFEYGWMLLKTAQLDHAARVGARAASLADADGLTVENRITDTLAASGITGATIEVLPGEPGSIPAGTVVTVRIAVDYANTSLLGLGSFMPLPSSIQGQAAMVREP